MKRKADQKFIDIVQDEVSSLLDRCPPLKASSGGCPLPAGSETNLLAAITAFLSIPTELSANP